MHFFGLSLLKSFGVEHTVEVWNLLSLEFIADELATQSGANVGARDNNDPLKVWYSEIVAEADNEVSHKHRDYIVHNLL